MKIRLANQTDVKRMQEIFAYGRKVQRESGNMTQWKKGYPSESLMMEDIEKRAAHLCLNEQDEIVAVFSIFTEADPTYATIDGEWLNDEDYTTIHRIASDGSVPGIGQDCIAWVQERYSNIRIDTHEQNEQMKHILKKMGFQYCGVINLENGERRNAYQYLEKI